MRTIEAIGRTVDDAIAKGLEQLGVPREDAEVTVIDEGSKGVFGFLGVKLARVQICVASLEEPEPSAEEEEEPEEPVRHYAAPREKPAAPPVEKSSHPAAQFLYEIARLMDLSEPEIVVQEDETGTVHVSVDGPNVGPFIGHHGDALDALQLLTTLVVNPQGHDSSAYHKVVLDVSGYRERRAQTLERLARRLANKVIATGEAVDLEPMNAYERRIIHTALSDFDEIETWSEGDEPYRHIVIDLIQTDADYDDEDYKDDDN